MRKIPALFAATALVATLSACTAARPATIDGCTLAGRGGAGPGCQWTMLKKETARLPGAPDRPKDTGPAKSNRAGVVNLSAHKR